MGTTMLPLKIAIGLVMVVAIIELSFVSSMVGWIHATASKGFEVRGNDGNTFTFIGEPVNFMVDQGHTSNAVAGTGFILIGLGGILGLLLRRKSNTGAVNGRTLIYYLWMAVQIPAMLLLTGALAYVFTVTNRYTNQTIDVNVASRLANGLKYPLDTWVPQGWFTAMLKDLDFANASQRADVQSHLRTVRGWQWNLIPFFIIQLAETVLAFVDFKRWRQAMTSGAPHVTSSKADMA